MNFAFVVKSMLLGVGLAMDAFSVSLANGLANPKMTQKEAFRIAGCFSFFQLAMPLIGWFFVRSLSERFAAFSRAVPYIGFVLLLYIGGKMLIETLASREEKGYTSKEAGDSAFAAENDGSSKSLDMATLILQGIATSIDALSVGFAFSEYAAPAALVAALLIAAVTLFICLIGVELGKRFGMKLSRFGGALGGIILIGIGVHLLL